MWFGNPGGTCRLARIFRSLQIRRAAPANTTSTEATIPAMAPLLRGLDGDVELAGRPEDCAAGAAGEGVDSRVLLGAALSTVFEVALAPEDPGVGVSDDEAVEERLDEESDEVTRSRSRKNHSPQFVITNVCDSSERVGEE